MTDPTIIRSPGLILGNEDLVCEWQPPLPQPLPPISIDCQLQAVRDAIEVFK